MLLAQVVIDARAAQVRAREAEGDGLFLGDDADVARAVHEDAVAREQAVDLVERGMNFLQELLATAPRTCSGRSRICPPMRV